MGKPSKTELCWIAAGIFLLLAWLMPFYPFIQGFCYAFCAVPLLYLLSGKLPAKAGRILRRSVAILLTVVLILCSAVGFMIGSATGGTDGEAEYLIVLGTEVRGSDPSPQLEDRIDAAAEYLAAHPDMTAILSGGKGDYNTLNEAHCMFYRISAKGISRDRMILEHKSTSTEENLAFSMALIEELSGSRPAKVAVLSSEYHLFRVSMFAEEQNIDVILVPATTVELLSFANSFLREIFMVIYYGTIG